MGRALFFVQVAEAAGREGHAGWQRLQQGLSLAARHGVDAWPLQMRFAEALLLAQRADAEGRSCIQVMPCSNSAMPCSEMHPKGALCSHRLLALLTDSWRFAQTLQPELLQRPRDAVQSLAARVWPHLPSGSHVEQALVLSLVEDCLPRLLVCRRRTHNSCVIINVRLCA